MFTGIIETLGVVMQTESKGKNLQIRMECSFASELKINQSIAHNGVCLSVTAVYPQQSHYEVTAIEETLKKTTLSTIKVGNKMNLERCLLVESRWDGHMVQGHVDQTARIKSVTEQNGSWLFCFEFTTKPAYTMVEKGSVCIDGISLTVVSVTEHEFCVAIIPYTYKNTNLSKFSPNHYVNVEFDIIGKYLERLSKAYKFV